MELGGLVNCEAVMIKEVEAVDLAVAAPLGPAVWEQAKEFKKGEDVCLGVVAFPGQARMEEAAADEATAEGPEEGRLAAVPCFPVWGTVHPASGGPGTGHSSGGLAETAEKKVAEAMSESEDSDGSVHESDYDLTLEQTAEAEAAGARAREGWLRTRNARQVAERGGPRPGISGEAPAK